jgi:3-oxoacyl-[acyl-carrier protein] reductase
MKHAVITGASSGIGRAAAQKFVEQGWHVHTVSRRPCDVSGVVNHVVDLADLNALRGMAEKLLQHFDKAEQICLVHNAGELFSDDLHTFSAERFEHLMRVNVTAPALLTSLLRPALSLGSSVIFIGSTLSEKSVPNRLSYATSKHALVGLMRGVCQDLFGSGIHAVCICPGFTDTDMVRSQFTSEFKEKVLQMVSFGRLVAPEEIAELIYEAARMPALNGAVIHANLGQREL